MKYQRRKEVHDFMFTPETAFHTASLIKELLPDHEVLTRGGYYTILSKREMQELDALIRVRECGNEWVFKEQAEKRLQFLYNNQPFFIFIGDWMKITPLVLDSVSFQEKSFSVLRGNEVDAFKFNGFNVLEAQEFFRTFNQEFKIAESSSYDSSLFEEMGILLRTGSKIALYSNEDCAWPSVSAGRTIVHQGGDLFFDVDTGVFDSIFESIQ